MSRLKLQLAKAVESYPDGGHDRVEIFALEETCVIAVADGMGGRSGAAEAAEGWIEAVRSCLENSDQWSAPDFWAGIMGRADRAIAEDRQAGETTAVVAAVTKAGIVGASVGDSGAILMRADGDVELTRGQVRKPGLGSGMAIVVPFEHELVEGTLVAGTDGLMKYATRAAIRRAALGDAVAEAARELVEAVRLPSGGLQDDVGVGVCRIEMA